MYLLPKIRSLYFPNYVRGVGVLTPVQLRVSGWGILNVKVINHREFTTYKKILSPADHEFELYVPKGKRIQVRLWSLFGWTTLAVDVPDNNTPVSAPQVIRAACRLVPKTSFTLPRPSRELDAPQSLRAKLSTLKLSANSTEYKWRAQIKHFQAREDLPVVSHQAGYRYVPPNFASRLHRGALKTPSGEL